MLSCVDDTPTSKRPKMRSSDMSHAAWVANQEEAHPTDFLKTLYPHARDADCYMEEATHTYYVHSLPYSCSVSSVWKVFFAEFDAPCKAQELLAKAKTEGVRNFASSLYNLYVYLLMEKQYTPDSELFFWAVEDACAKGVQYYKEQGWSWGYPDVQGGVDLMKELVYGACAKPQKGKTCYFLVMSAGCAAAELCGTWEANGALESFKGTLMHKRAELYMQELAAWQLEQNRSHVTLGEMQAIAGVAFRAETAASVAHALADIAPHTKAELWDHVATQAYLATLFDDSDVPEFAQLVCWFESNPTLSPFRSEWSIFDDDSRVAGQVDSLWFDEAANGAIVMVDWKRARQLLSPSLQHEQSFGEKNTKTCSFAPAASNPCRSMYNCAYSHYLVQQHLYADFLARKYEVVVERMYLVQCHPSLGKTKNDYNVAALEHIHGLASRVLKAFDAGWKKLLVHPNKA